MAQRPLPQRRATPPRRESRREGIELVADAPLDRVHVYGPRTTPLATPVMLVVVIFLHTPTGPLSMRKKKSAG